MPRKGACATLRRRRRVCTTTCSVFSAVSQFWRGRLDVSRGWRWCRRNKAVAGLLGTVTALLLVLSIGGPIAGIKQARLIRQAQAELSAKNINQLYQDWYSGNVERVGEELKRHYATADNR